MKEIAEKTGGVEYRTISEDDAGMRVDNYLIRELRGVPKSRIYHILRKGEVRVNKGRVKPERKILEGDVIRIPPIRMAAAPVVKPSAKLGKVSCLKDAVIFENEGLLVVNKPAHIAVHGGSGVDFGVIEAMRSLRSEAHFLELVHRLDRETSGCLLIAKKRSALRTLQAEFRDKIVHKYYLALVAGNFPEDHCTVDIPLLRIEKADGNRVVRPDRINGKPSVTEFIVRERLFGATLIECRPHTGRTHQIRVHLAYKGFPILGDEKYGTRSNDVPFVEKGLRRMFLHAAGITFIDPTNEKKTTVEAPLPEELEQLLSELRLNKEKENN